MALFDDFLGKLGIARHWMTVAAAFTLPWTTTGQAIAIGLFTLLAVLTIRPARLAATMRHPAALLPTLLFLLILVSMLWSTQPFGPSGMDHYAKLLLIPLLMATSISPRQALHIAYGFLAASSILLVLSWAGILWPAGPFDWFKNVGVPVKDNAVQSLCFVLCGFGLALGAWRLRSENRTRAMLMALLALLFLANIHFIFVSKTGLLGEIALAGLFLLHITTWQRALLLFIPTVLVIALALSFSAPAQHRLNEFASDMRAQDVSGESVSTAARIDFWNKAIVFIKQAPLLGHGSGSTLGLYQAEETTHPSPYGGPTSDPHNQILAITIQVGLSGAVLLVLMWLSHARLFLGRNFACAMGQAVVLLNVVGSLFNSHLSTITQGVLYCLAVGVLGAITMHKTVQPALEKPTAESLAPST